VRSACTDAAVAKDVVIVGSSFREGLTVKTHNSTKGLGARMRSGKLLWTFNTIPRPVSSAPKPGKKSRGRSTAHRRLVADYGR
jgi:hypothetical protein